MSPAKWRTTNSVWPYRGLVKCMFWLRCFSYSIDLKVSALPRSPIFPCSSSSGKIPAGLAHSSWITPELSRKVTSVTSTPSSS